MELFRGYAFSNVTCSRLSEFLGEYLANKKPVFLCLGTDKVVGDCMAPLVADFLRQQELPYYIYGGLSAPITAQNCEFAFEFTRSVHTDSDIILIDSMATREQARLGDIVVSEEYYGAINSLKIKPDLCIYGVTSILKNGLLNSARLYNVEKTAKIIAKSIKNAINLHKFAKNIDILCS
ncbi:MAG: DUF1256 domain-containing protein [Clostridia bacterium]|nr:DUF1256 domain-containing protein [Clostridia bacterium]